MRDHLDENYKSKRSASILPKDGISKNYNLQKQMSLDLNCRTDNEFGIRKFMNEDKHKFYQHERLEEERFIPARSDLVLYNKERIRTPSPVRRVMCRHYRFHFSNRCS